MPSPGGPDALRRVARVPALHRAPPAGVPMLSCPPSLRWGARSTRTRRRLGPVLTLSLASRPLLSPLRLSIVRARSRLRAAEAGYLSRRSQPKTSEREAEMTLYFDPFRELDQLTQQIVSGGRSPRSCPMDAYRRGDEFIVHLDLPGADPSSIDVTVERNALTVRAERHFDFRRAMSCSLASDPRASSADSSRLGPLLTPTASGRATRVAS
jgi:hypothetical protein